jgi:hypothetical protein
MACWTLNHGFMNALHMEYNTSTHVIFTPLPMAYRTPSYVIMKPPVLVDMVSSIYHDEVQSAKYKDENLTPGSKYHMVCWFHEGVDQKGKLMRNHQAN